MVVSDPSLVLTAREAQSVSVLVNDAIGEGWKACDDNMLRCCEKIVEVEGVCVVGVSDA